MSRRNRQKRTAKQKNSRRASPHREHRGADPGYDRVIVLEHLIAALYGSAMCPEHDAEFHAAELVEEFPGSVRDIDAAAEAALSGAIRAAWEAGWSPSDLHELARRKLDATATGYLAGAIVLESRQYAVATLHPRWRADLATLSAVIEPGPTRLSDWAVRHAVDNRAALAFVLTVLQLLGTLPVLEPLLPLPGAHRHSSVVVSEGDAKALGRVRGLLAEATPFPEEAEAMSAKAQELMSRYSLHHAIRDHELGRAAEAVAQRIWIDNPYVGAKAALVQAVATANRCRTVWAEKLGFVTVVGAESEVKFVELLATSLLVQANRAMLAVGHQTSNGQARTRSFRQSFLVAYATRIGERLTTTNTTVATEVDQRALLPVLASRSQATDDLTNRLFPAAVPRALSVSNGAGWSAGRAAADLAQLDARRPIAG